MSKYKGVIIEESLENRALLKWLKIVSTKVEKVIFYFKLFCFVAFSQKALKTGSEKTTTVLHSIVVK